MRLNDLVRRLDELIANGEDALRHLDDSGGSMQAVKPTRYSEFKSASVSFLDRTFGPLSAYSSQFRQEVSTPALYCMHRGLGVLRGARGELAGGWITSTRGLLSAEVFADFLDMAEHLLDNGYKDPAAVIIGGTLEEHLRQLAAANDIPIEEPQGRQDGPPESRSD